MTPKTFIVGCVECGPMRELSLDLESEKDVARLGIAVAEVLADDHTAVVMDKTLSEMASEGANALGAAVVVLPDSADSHWKDLN